MVPIDSSIKHYPEDKLFSALLYGSEDFNSDKIKKKKKIKLTILNIW